MANFWDNDPVVGGASSAPAEFWANDPVDGPPAGAKPGSREYADWAMSQARAGKTLPQVSEAPEFEAPKPDGLMDKAFTAAGSFIEGVPIAGPTLIDFAKQGRAAVQGMTPEAVGEEFLAAKEANPLTSLAGNITGSVAALAPLGATALGGRLLGTTGTIGQRLSMGALSGGAISGADTAARGGDLGQIGTNAAFGGLLGMAFPAAGALKNQIGQRIAQGRATNAAIANAPAASELKSAASSLFKQVDQAGVTVAPQEFRKLVLDLATKAKNMRINDKLDPKAYATFQELGGVMGEVLAGRPLTLSDMHTLRQIAQKAAISSEGRDAMFANQIVDGIDAFVTKPGATVTPNGPATGKQLMEAISTWGRAKRVGLVETAIERAQNAASGFENGLRVEFRKLLNNKKTAGIFSATEKSEIERVVRGTPGANLAKLVGKFGFGSGNASNMLGGSIGSTFGAAIGSPLGPFGSAAGAAIAGGGATLARRASENLTAKAAERAAKVVATPNIPTVPLRALPPGILPPALLPLETTKKRQPIEITVTGGAR